MSPYTVRDRLSVMPEASMSVAAFLPLEGMQRCEDPAQQVAGLAAAFVVLCDELRVEPREMLQFVHNSLFHGGRDDTMRSEHYRALRVYIRDEILS